MRSRLRVLEGSVSRLEGFAETELWQATVNVRGWSSQWFDSLPADEQATLTRWAVQRWRLRDAQGPEAEAERVVLDASVADLFDRERWAVCERIGAHLVGMAEPERSRWKALYVEALEAAGIGPRTDEDESPGTGAGRVSRGP